MKSIRTYLLQIQKDPAKRLYAMAAFLGCITVFLTVFFGVQYVKEQSKNTPLLLLESVPGSPEHRCEFVRALDGVCVERAELEHESVVAVMIENHVDAQPLSGVASAAVVYEAPVEGSIPRLMALYPASVDVSQLGPVRSARPYYIDWLLEYPGAMYMHVGGSPEALGKITGNDVFDMNEFSRGWYFWRSMDRYAPHNAYTSSQLWKLARERYESSSTPDILETWQFADTIEMCETDCVDTIDLSYGGGMYYPQWRFDTESGRYERYEYGRADADQDGEHIFADTVIVQYVHATVVDEVGRLHLGTIGSGDAVVFVGGRAIEGTWQKNDVRGRTVWLDSENNSIALAPGKIWVQVVSQFNSVEY